MDKLQSILKDLYLVLGLNISLFDVKEELISSYPIVDSPFCKLIKNNPESRKICRKCDHEAYERAKKSGVLEIYKCEFNLYEACVPLYWHGELAGFLMMGQALSDSAIEQDIIRSLAKPFIKDDTSLDEALKRIPIKTENEILAFSTILDMCANYLTTTNRVTVKEKNIAYEVKNYIIENLDEDITIETLCKKFFCSKATLTSRFKDEFNTTIHLFILETKLAKAKKILENQDIAIQKVASLCGFDDANYFSKAFKRVYGISPKQFRSNINDKN